VNEEALAHLGLLRQMKKIISGISHWTTNDLIEWDVQLLNFISVTTINSSAGKDSYWEDRDNPVTPAYPEQTLRKVLLTQRATPPVLRL
jgi:hypothetical protein